MKLSIKNLKGEVFTVEVEPTDNIPTLKAKIQEAKGLPADTLKLVYKGKTVAADETTTIESLGFKETDFIVVMAQVQKPKPKDEVKPEAPKEQPKAEEKKEVKQEVKQEAPKPVQPPAANHEAEINELMSMGFPREQCEAALRAAFYNVQRAVDYIFNGIPANLQQGIEPEEGPEEVGGGEQPGPEQLRAIFNHPQLASIRNLIRQNPAALQPVLAQLAQSAPQLYNLITQYPQEFEQIIMEAEGAQGQGQAQGQEQPNPRPGTILISQAEEQAINRLRQLGFSKIESAQAYFACDKNEQLAANLLFDRLANGDIEMQPQNPGGNPPPGGQGGQGGSHNNQDDDDNLFN